MNLFTSFSLTCSYASDLLYEVVGVNEDECFVSALWYTEQKNNVHAPLVERTRDED